MKNKALIIIVFNCLLIPFRAFEIVNETAIDTQVNYKALQKIICVVESFKGSVPATFRKYEHLKFCPIKRKMTMRRSAPRCPGF